MLKTHVSPMTPDKEKIPSALFSLCILVVSAAVMNGNMLLAAANASSSSSPLVADSDAAWGYAATSAVTLPSGSPLYVSPSSWGSRYEVCGGTVSTGKRSSGYRQSPINFQQVPVDPSLFPLTVTPYYLTSLSLHVHPQRSVVLRPRTQQNSTTTTTTTSSSSASGTTASSATTGTAASSTVSSPALPMVMDRSSGRVYVLSEIRLHTPSEHTFGGATRDLEVQYFFSETAASSSSSSSLLGDASSGSSVFAIATTYGAERYGRSALLDDLLVGGLDQYASVQASAAATAATAFNEAGFGRRVAMQEIGPVSRDYFRYAGSLTAPPCSETVLWNVYAEQQTMGIAQLDAIRRLLRLPTMGDDATFSATFNASGDTGAGAADAAVLGNHRPLLATPKAPQPLVGGATTTSGQKKTADYLQRSRTLTQGEIFAVRRFCDFIGDEWLDNTVAPNSLNDHVEAYATAAVVIACVSVVVVILAAVISRA